ncbi:MAG: hypothetical protein K0U37_09750 [Gammaproteobacteria bacterium]|nr:hypothetical protein [Gammaproteobacteria bacterium]
MPHKFKTLAARLDMALETFHGTANNGISQHVDSLRNEELALRSELGLNPSASQQIRSLKLRGQIDVLERVQEHFQKLEESINNSTAPSSRNESIISADQQEKFLTESRALADTIYYGIGRYDSAFIAQIETYAKPIIGVIDDFSEALEEPLHIKKGLELEQTVQTIIDEATKLQERFVRYKAEFNPMSAKPSATLEALVQTLLEKAETVKNTYLINLEDGSCRVPIPGTDRSKAEKAAYAALTQLTQTAQLFEMQAQDTDTANAKVLRRDPSTLITEGTNIIVNILKDIAELHAAQTTASMRQSVAAVRTPSQTSSDSGLSSDNPDSDSSTSSLH